MLSEGRRTSLLWVIVVWVASVQEVLQLHFPIICSKYKSDVTGIDNVDTPECINDAFHRAVHLQI